MRRPLASVAVAWLAVAGATAPAAAVAGPAAPRGYVQALFLLHHPAGLDRFVRSVSDPRSPRYRHYATVEELVKRFGASPAVRRATLAWLARHGMRGRVGPTGAYLIAWMPSELAKRALPRRAPATGSATGTAVVVRRVPPALRGYVDAIGILGTRPGAFGHTASVAPASADGAAVRGGSSLLPHSGTAAGCPSGRAAGAPSPLSAFTPNQYLTAYGHEAMHRRGFRGKGTSAAVIEIDGFRHSDVVAFGRCFGVRVAADPRGPGRTEETAPAGRRDDARPRGPLSVCARTEADLRLRGRVLGGGGAAQHSGGAGLEGAPSQRDLDLARRLRAAAESLPRVSTCAGQRLRRRRRSRDLDAGRHRGRGLQRLRGRNPRRQDRAAAAARSANRPARRS